MLAVADVGNQYKHRSQSVTTLPFLARSLDPIPHLDGWIDPRPAADHGALAKDQQEQSPHDEKQGITNKKNNTWHTKQTNLKTSLTALLFPLPPSERTVNTFFTIPNTLPWPLVDTTYHRVVVLFLYFEFAFT